MGHPSSTETQGNNEGSVAPLPPTKATLRAWMPILRRVVAVTLGGLGLAGIGALSMAQTPAQQTPTLASSATPALANMVSPTEWLAPSPVPAAASTTPPPKVEPAPSTNPPCPPPSAPESDASSAGVTSTNSPGSGILPDGRIILNVANSAELTTLPGIGQKRADAIIALRTRLKGFRKLSDLLRVKGIGVKSLRKLEPKLVLDVPKEAD